MITTIPVIVICLPNAVPTSKDYRDPIDHDVPPRCRPPPSKDYYPTVHHDAPLYRHPPPIKEYRRPDPHDSDTQEPRGKKRKLQDVNDGTLHFTKPLPKRVRESTVAGPSRLPRGHINAVADPLEPLVIITSIKIIMMMKFGDRMKILTGLSEIAV
ncbi:hypothetical protein Hypma_012511 [Hypsizygus marmoreus]|uniref:Uncharacterized protein n=1 Tax=Hypsizygus marmoreus TaxID=39966 RepID=A0A369JGQ4_HYPMA|nr:hypothetical protein Hypma_012511 [Hypsizygus marmoreus]